MAKILVVDDRATNREFLTTLLGYGGHYLLEAGDGAEALAIAKKERPDLVIADILMPTMDGYELVRQLRDDPAIAQTPVIFYTAHYHEQEAHALARACGVACVLVKPSEPETILNAVATALGITPPPSSPAATEDFDREHLRLLTDKLSEKADDLKRTNERLSALVDLGLQFGSETDLRRLLQTFGHGAREILGARYAIMAVVNTDGSGLRHVVASGMNPETAAHLGSPDFRAEIFRPVLNEGRCVRLQNPGGNAAALGLASSYPPIHALLVAPIRSPARIYGWASFIDKIGAERFNEEDERLATILAAQVGRIYQNGSLYADVLQHASELELEVFERKRAEQRLQHVVTSSPAVLFTLAIENQKILGISWMSHNILNMLGYPESDTHGADWWTGNVHPDDVQPIIDTVHQEMFAKGVVTYEFRFRHRNGTYRWVRSEIRLMRDAAGKPIEAVGSWSDITERKQLEEQFRQAQKMEAVGQLAGGVAHDFNNLLTVILGYSDIVFDRLGPDDPIRDFVDEVRKSGTRAASLTRQLLAFSRKQILVPEIVDLNGLAGEMEKMLTRLIGEDIDLKFFAEANLWKVKVDRGQMEQVIMNLVVNARDAMPQGGKLTIATANVEIDESYTSVHPYMQPGPFVLVSVSDTGCGMDEATRLRAFEPFFTTKGPEKGTGLGLSTVFGIVKQSNGFIEVYSEPGKGSTFKIYLPRVGDELPKKKSRSMELARRHAVETVMLVEDEGAVRLLARLILEKAGYKVIEASNGSDALLMSQQYAGPIQIMLTDVVMPDMSGPQLAQQLTALRPDMKVLFLSGYTDDAIVRHGIINEDFPFLQKPFTRDGLLKKLREALDQEL